MVLSLLVVFESLSFTAGFESVSLLVTVVLSFPAGFESVSLLVPVVVLLPTLVLPMLLILFV